MAKHVAVVVMDVAARENVQPMRNWPLRDKRREDQ